MDNTKPQPGGWTIVALLFFFMLLNFVDKAVIGVAALPIMKELGLTPKEFGAVNSAFFALFSISAVVTGFLVNRIQSRVALLVMAAIWALTQFPMLGTISFTTLLACRVALGAGEGPAYPVALHAAYKWFPNHLRTLPSAFIAQGASVGVVLAIPVLEWVIEEYSWHAAFGLLGVAGLIWVAAWWLWGKEGALAVQTADTGKALHAVPYAKLIFNPTSLAIFATGFGAYWGLSLLIAWFPPFLVQGLHYTPHEAGFITTLPWAAGPFVVIFSGWLSQKMLTIGFTTRAARGVFGGGCVAIGGVALILMGQMPSNVLQIAMMVIGISVPSVVYVMGHAMMSEYTPVAQRGAMLGINNAVATSAGLVAPYVMGSVVQDALAAGATAASGYTHGFFICGVVGLVCGLLGIVFLSPAAQAARFAEAAA